MRDLNDGGREIFRLGAAQSPIPVKTQRANLGGDWRPIETAPLDGSRVLLWGHDIAGEKREFTEPLYGHWARQQWQVWGPDGRYVVRATHWHPLPDRP